MDKATSDALVNVFLLIEARRAGLTIYKEETFINYNDIDFQLSTLEDGAIARVKRDILVLTRDILATIEDKDDVRPIDTTDIYHAHILDHIKDVWHYGQQTADQELQQMGFAGNDDYANLTNDDAFEWYDRYAKELAKNASDALYVKMQPLILEALENGTVALTLADTLATEFARYGSVRAEIIARTESNKAFNWGRRYRFDQSAAIAGYRYSSVLDRRTSDICTNLHGTSWAIDDADLNNYTPPNHYKCRGILVPISKFVDHTFTGTSPDFERNLPNKERFVLEKFKSTDFYPMPANVKNMRIPKVATTTKPATPAAAATKVKKPATPAVKKAKPAPETPAVTPLDDDTLHYIKDTHQAALWRLEDGITSNNLAVNHPLAVQARRLKADINAGLYDGKMITANYDSYGKVTVTEYERYKNSTLFINADKTLKKADYNRMIKEIEAVQDDPVFRNLKIKLSSGGGVERGALAYYSPVDDLILLTGRTERMRATLLHEGGHRVHNIYGLDKSRDKYPYTGKVPVKVDAADWETFKQLSNDFEFKRGLHHINDNRWIYPTQAQMYYKNGTKQHFYKEMFAESTSVYLENNQQEYDIMHRKFPGLLEHMEKIYKRGYVKEVST